MNTPVRRTPSDALSCAPSPPLYIGFPSQVWMIESVTNCLYDSDGDDFSYRLLVDEESARHMLRDYIIETYRHETLPADIEDIAKQAQQDWVQGEGTTYIRENDGFVYSVRAFREDVWVAAPGSMKTLNLARRDALGALGM